MKATATEVRADVILQFWDMEEVHDKTTPFTKRLFDGRYSVSLPRCIPTPVLGEPRGGTALKRFFANKRSFTRKVSWASVSVAVNEYGEMGHAKRVPDDELQKPRKNCYYLPMHGVTKESSTTTKLRVVFDASAKTTSGFSLNDTLLTGPSLYPSLSSILNRFRCHSIGMSADISKMFR